MGTVTLIIIGVVVLVLLGSIVMLLQRRWADSNTGALPNVRYHSAADIPDGERAAIRALLDGGNKIAAIKRVRDMTGIGLKEAKDFVESWESSGATPALTINEPVAPTHDLAEVRALAQAGNKIEAIKLYRQLAGVGLKEAKDYVDSL